MTTSRVASVLRRLAGRPWRRFGRWGRTRRLAGVRLSQSGLHEPQPVQGPRPPQAVRDPAWVRFDDRLARKTRPVPQLPALPAGAADFDDPLAKNGGMP
jgi:hypothetical protein